MSSVVSQSVLADELLALKREYMMPCVYHFFGDEAPAIVAAKDVFLIDDTGKQYLDCYSGVTVMNAGHCNRQITLPAVDQIHRLQHTTSIYLTEPVLRLAKKLAEITPGNLKRSFFCASGSEAIEGAMLSAVLHTGRSKLVATSTGLHGRTRWAMNATGLDMWRTDPSPLPDVSHVPFGDIDALRNCFETSSNEIAAFVVEPIQGNGGINVSPNGYLSLVRELCNEFGVLLVLDEIQTGMSRTGKWFCCDHDNVTPDILVMSKALGNGFPIAAFICTDEVAQSYTRPGASTYGGNPVCATAALATIAFHEKENLAERAATLGDELEKALNTLSDKHESLGRPRGRGLMWGIPIVHSDGSPDPQKCDVIMSLLMHRGFMLGKTGPARNVLTFMPPLTIKEKQIGEFTNALDAIAAVADDWV